VTVATGTGFTVIVGVGLEVTDSLVAEIVADPTPTAVTVAGEPFALTVRTAVLLETQVTVRPVSGLPFASRVVAVSCCVPPTIIGVAGVEIVTEATGAGDTLTEEVPTFPSLVAVIVVVPAPIAVTRPFPSTAAAAVLLELHVTVRPVSMLPFASLVSAVSCCVGVIPTTRLTVAGVTVTVATGAAVTVRGALPVFPSLIATMFVEPALTAVTSPAGDETVATAVLSELHATERPVSTRPLESRSVAVA
jgi:hypothetical protein